MSWILVALGLLLAMPGAMVACQYTLLTAASLFYREPRAPGRHRLRFLVLIPAHNEEAVLPRTLAAVNGALREGDQVLVVDDRSLDRTAAIAAEHGALVLSRHPGEPPGRAAARQAGIRVALSLDWDAIAMIDADSVVQAGYLGACEAVLATGAEAVQARSDAMPARSLMSQSSLAAFALQSVTIPRGRDRLGLSVRLKGTGMVLRRRVVERHGFRGPGAGEDLWLSNDLCLAGILARHADSARLHSESARSVRVATGQRVRWEAGRMIAAREFLVPLLRRRSLPSLEAAWHLVTPPFSLALVSLIGGAALLLLAHAGPIAWVVLGLLSLLGLDLLASLVQAGVPMATWLALPTAPAYLVWKLWVQLRALLLVLRHERNFAPTPRN